MFFAVTVQKINTILNEVSTYEQKERTNFLNLSKNCYFMSLSFSSSGQQNFFVWLFQLYTAQSLAARHPSNICFSSRYECPVELDLLFSKNVGLTTHIPTHGAFPAPKPIMYYERPNYCDLGNSSVPQISLNGRCQETFISIFFQTAAPHAT